MLHRSYKSIPRIQIRDLYGRAVQILFPEGDVWLRHQFVKRNTFRVRVVQPMKQNKVMRIAKPKGLLLQSFALEDRFVRLTKRVRV